MDISDKEKFRVLALLDGRPGHEKQTRGILRELESIVPLEIEWRKVPYNSFFSDSFSTLYLLLMSAFKKKTVKKDFDFVLGTGRRTHLPAIQEKLSKGAIALTCMTPSFHLKPLFDLCFIPEHDGGEEGENTFFTTGPANLSDSSGDHAKDKGLILIGGTDKSHTWNDDQILEAINSLVRGDKAVSWTISSSPRTPASCVSRLENLEKELENSRFYRYEKTPAGWVEQQYAASGTVWVTSDSMSMVYEALTAGCNVGLLPVNWKRENSKFARSEAQLLKKKIVFSFEEWKSGKQISEINKEPLNEGKRCAEEIVRRWCRKS